MDDWDGTVDVSERVDLLTPLEQREFQTLHEIAYNTGDVRTVKRLQEMKRKNRALKEKRTLLRAGLSAELV